jgi:hypothetical protein
MQLGRKIASHTGSPISIYRYPGQLEAGRCAKSGEKNER